MTEMEKGVVSGKVRQQTQVTMKDEGDERRVVSNKIWRESKRVVERRGKREACESGKVTEDMVSLSP